MTLSHGAEAPHRAPDEDRPAPPPRRRAVARRPGRGRPLRLIGFAVFLAVIAFITVYPVVLLMIRSLQESQPWEAVTWGLENWARAFSDPLLPSAIGNTFVLAIVRVVLAGALGVFFAWAVARTNIPLRRSIEIVLALGFFIPVLPMVFGWLLLLDPKSGLINQPLQDWFGLSQGPIDIYSRYGIVLANLATTTSVMFILVSPAFRNIDPALEEAGAISGLGRWGVIRWISVPVVAPAIGIALILVLVKSLESFELELVLGVPGGIYVYSTLVWQFLRVDPPAYGAATALSVVFLVGLLALITVQRRSLRGKEFTTIAARGAGAGSIRLGRWRWPVTACILTFIAVFVLLPLGFLVAGTFMRVFGFFHIPSPWTGEHWADALSDDGLLSSLVRTAVLGLGAGVLGALVTAVVAYWLVRSKSALRIPVDFVTWLPWALPGVLVSLALLWMFLGSGPVLQVLYGTLSVLIIAIIIKEFPLGVQMQKAGVMQIDPTLEEAARMAGRSRVAAFRLVTLRLLLPTTAMVGLLMFVVAAREIAGLIFLTNPTTAPLAPRMLYLMEEGKLEQGAVIGVILTVIVVIAAVLSLWVGRERRGRRR